MKTRKQFILSELIFPFCYTLLCIVSAFLCYILSGNNKSDLGVTVFSMFGILSVFIWIPHVNHATDIKNYFEYLQDYKTKKAIQEDYKNKIKE